MSSPYSTPENQNFGQVPTALRQEIRGGQIITLALVTGVLTFMGIALAVCGGNLSGQPDVLSWMAVGVAVLMLITSVIISRFVAHSAISRISTAEFREADETQQAVMIHQAFRIRQIVACAMLEGAAFFNLVAYIVTKYVGNLGAAGVLVILMAFSFPTSTRVQFWIQDRMREIELR